MYMETHLCNVCGLIQYSSLVRNFLFYVKTTCYAYDTDYHFLNSPFWWMRVRVISFSQQWNKLSRVWSIPRIKMNLFSKEEQHESASIFQMDDYTKT
jgi:hypothetical protein